MVNKQYVRQGKLVKVCDYPIPLCVRVCPIDLLVVDWKLESYFRKKRLLNYSIDSEFVYFMVIVLSIVQTNCLSMTEEYELSTYDHHELYYNQIALGLLPISISDDYTIRSILNLPQTKEKSRD
ncbi:NAD(P)H-quinone oxidoreductase subunit I chloroplastic [Bienertia sinuspersici]